MVTLAKATLAVKKIAIRQAKKPMGLMPYFNMATTDNIIEIVKSYIGDSLVNNKDDLAELVARGVDDPNQIVQVHTNCGLFALGVWCLVGVQHDLLKTKYQNGMAIAWVRKIAIAKGALRSYPQDGPPIAGAALHYYTPGTNNNHIEILLEDPNDKMIALHGGGGRDKNLISSNTSDIRWSNTPDRKLREWIDPVALLVGSPEFQWNPKENST